MGRIYTGFQEGAGQTGAWVLELYFLGKKIVNGASSVEEDTANSALLMWVRERLMRGLVSGRIW